MPDDPATSSEPAETPFHETLSEQTRDQGDFSKFKSADDLAVSYVNMHKQQRDAAVPGDDATPEQRDAFYARIGRPDKPDDYQFSSIDGLPDKTIPDDRMAEFRELAHKNGLTQNQVAGLYNKYADWTKNDIAAISHAREAQSNEWSESIRKEHGEAFDQNLKVATNARDDLKIDGLQDMLNDTGAGDHPAMFNLFLKLGKMMGQDQLVAGDGGSFKFGPGAALDEIGRLKADPKFMQLVTRTHLPGHKEAMQRWEELHQQAHPDPAT